MDGLVRHDFGDTTLTHAGETKECACAAVSVVAEVEHGKLWVVICTKVQ